MKDKTNNRPEYQGVEFTSEDIVPVIGRKRDSAFQIYERDWKRLEVTVRQLTGGVKWWEQIAVFGFSSALTFFITYVTYPNDAPVSQVIIVGLWVALTIGVLASIFTYAQRNHTLKTKDSVLEEMEYIESLRADSEPTLEEEGFDQVANQTVPEWTGHTTDRSQGTDHYELPLNGALLQSLSFKVSSGSEYWRAGFKLASPNADATSNLLTDNSFLFHVGLKEGRFVLSIYENGDTDNAIHKELTNIDLSQPVTLTVERNRKNYVRCFVNDTLEFNKRLDPEIFKKAYIVTWGDGHEYTVDIGDISYTYA